MLRFVTFSSWGWSHLSFAIWVTEFCHNKFWDLTQFEFLGFVTTWVFGFCHNLRFWVLLQFEFWQGFFYFILNLSFRELTKLGFWVFFLLKIWGFWVLSELQFLNFVAYEFLIFVTNYIFEGCHKRLSRRIRNWFVYLTAFACKMERVMFWESDQRFFSFIQKETN